MQTHFVFIFVIIDLSGLNNSYCFDAVHVGLGLAHFLEDT